MIKIIYLVDIFLTEFTTVSVQVAIEGIFEFVKEEVCR
jgi:hypothetical protein